MLLHFNKQFPMIAFQVKHTDTEGQYPQHQMEHFDKNVGK